MKDLPLLLSAGLLAGLCGCAHSPLKTYQPPSGPTVWNFDGAADPLAAASGSARLSYRDPGNTGWGPAKTAFGSASSLGLPPVNGTDARVMGFPACEPSQGYTITHNSPPNGVYVMDGQVSNYTLIMDLLLPPGNEKKLAALYQTSGGNADEAEMFLETRPGGGIGINWLYSGALRPGTWHRVAWTVQCAVGAGGTGQISKFIDGRFVGGHYTPSDSPQCRWALGPAFHLFTDNALNTGRGFLASLLYADRLFTSGEIAALGRPSGRGADVPGPAPEPVKPAAARRVWVIGHRANTGDTPENTLSGIKQAFDAGADLVEVDVRMSADGVPVLMHDPDVDRTTDGAGPVSGKHFSELRALDAGSWFDRRYAGERVPTLAEALRAAKGRGRLFLDVKGYAMGRAIKNALRHAGVGPEAVWLSQGNSLKVAEDYRKHVPGAPIIWEGARPEKYTPEFLEGLKEKGIVGFDLDKNEVTKDFLDAARAAGMFVTVYTVLDVGQMLKLIELGVDGMETDYPAALDALMPPRQPR
jgi:glycerophosphoryl diester phosphodiesterase